MMSLLYPFTTMSFNAPVLLLTPAIILFIWLVRRDVRQVSVDVPSGALFDGLPISWRQRLRPIVLGALATCAVLSLAVAAARPQRISVVTTRESSRNIILAIDVSLSMAARDFSSMFGSITRLQAVQGVVSKFVERRAGDRLGLVVFGGGAYLQSPLTTDHGLVKQLVEQLQVGMAGEGTAIGDGLGVALKRIRALPAKSASVILLTDGVSNVGQVNPIKAAKIAADLGIKVHSVGIGSERAVTIRSPGNILSNLVQRHVEFDEETLKEISRITGGVFFSASDIEGLERVYEEIDKLEQSDEEAQEQVVAEELFVPYALLGLLAFLLYQILALTVFLRVPW